MLLPKEHGAYGQLVVPSLTALAAAGVSIGALLVTATAAVGFLAHEPAAVLLDARGPRARREHGREAAVWLAWCATLGCVAAAGALITMPSSARSWLIVPAVPAATVGWLTMRRREKTWYGELAASSALSLVAVPVAIASGASSSAAFDVAIPFVALFAASTLAVRAIIARVRGGGNPKTAAAARRIALGVTAVLALGIAVGAARGVLGATALIAAAPGLVAAAILSLRPPPPTKLRAVGWTLVGTSLATALIVLAGY